MAIMFNPRSYLATNLDPLVLAFGIVVGGEEQGRRRGFGIWNGVQGEGVGVEVWV
jgi:hypothetical protein